MKAKFQHIAAATAMLMVAGAVQASDGSVWVNGNVLADTCTITQTGGANSTISLPTLPASQFATAGNKGGDTLFAIELSECTAYTAGNDYQMLVWFEAGATVDPVTGNLKNTATGSTAATNVELEITDVAKSLKLKPGDLVNMNSTSRFYTTDTASGIFNYKVNYISTGLATAGAVTSQVTYSIRYN
ncbi:MAG: fimbrial protein [Limnohabitans sp.]